MIAPRNLEKQDEGPAFAIFPPQGRRLRWAWLVWNHGDASQRPTLSGEADSETGARLCAGASHGREILWALPQKVERLIKQDRELPHFSACAASGRWFWYAWPSADVYAPDGDFDYIEPMASGNCDTETEALSSAFSAIGGKRNPGLVFQLIKGRLRKIPKRYIYRLNGRLEAVYASGYRESLAAKRRAAKKSSGSSSAALEFVYADGKEHLKHRIVKRTKKRIYVERCYYSESSKPSAHWTDYCEPTFVLDREEFEREGCAPGRSWRYYYYAKPLEPRASDSPHLSTLGLKEPFTEVEARAAYRRAAKSTHPDAGGSPDDFRKVRAAFDVAMAILGEGLSS